MTITENFLKTYTDKTYQHTTMVRHNGTVVSLAMDQQRRIYYSVLNLDDDKPDSPLDVNYWLENPQELRFPNEISQVGYAIANSTLMPIVKKGSRDEAERGRLRMEEIDLFLSSTARLTADAPFQALSDEKYIYIFRQSIDENHEDTVFKLDQLPSQASGDSERTDYVKDADNHKVPLVKNTLLVDRFILAGIQLNPKMEVRYKRSRSKTNPHNSKDSLGAKDMEGNPFFEPTQELDFVRNLQQGRFSALLVPTQISGVQRWQIFAHNSSKGLIDSFNVERAADGLFNTKGSQYYTSPDPQYQKSVFERKPGTCPFTEQNLIPIVSKEGYGESALKFDGHDDYVDFGSIDFARGSYTIEAWFKTSVSGQMAIATARKADNTYGITLELLSDGKLRYLHRSGNTDDTDYTDYQINSTNVCNDNKWHHFSAVKNNSEQKLYLDGMLVATSSIVGNLTEGLIFVLGRLGYRSERHFDGLIDEVRLWKRARSAEEIQTDFNHRLVGNEVGLESYWRCDEGFGDTVYDQTENAMHGTIHGDTIWVDSDIPLGDNPGIRSSSFQFEGRTIESGIASLLYYQQEKSNAGYDQQPKPIKKNARVMLATATGGADSDENYVGVLDFGLSREGKLAQVPDNIDFGAALNKGTNDDLERLSQLEQEVLALQEEINQKQFSEAGKLQASDRQADDFFGDSIAISGDWAIVGSRTEDTGASNAGAAYIFQYQNGQWLQTQKLQASDRQKNAFFGGSVAISGDWVIVGAIGEYTGGIFSGAAYIFQNENGQWSQKQKLKASDKIQFDKFGSSVAISEDWAIVGAYQKDAGSAYMDAGAAYIFQNENGQWSQTQKLLASDKQTSDNFGDSVAISGDWVIVGANGEDEGGDLAGAAYIFQKNETGQWSQKQKLKASDKQAGDMFGGSVAISGDWVIVGAHVEDNAGGSDAGAVYIFQNENGQWSQKQKLLASDKEAVDHFGASVAISGDWAIVGSRRGDTGGDDAGAAYIFHYQNGQWLQTQKLLASDKEAGDYFGGSVAISGDRAIVGASREDTGGSSAGAAYIFSPIPMTQQKQELIAKKSEILELAGILDNNVTLPMHLLHTDSFGLSVAGGLLGFAYTNDTPQLFESALGKLALYFRGTTGQFFAAYYDTNTAKAQYTLAAEAENITFLARTAEPEMDNSTITLNDGTNANNCTVTMENTTAGITETWNQVPRNVIEFASVINGAASKQVFIGTLTTDISGTTASLSLTSKVKQALNNGDTLLVGSSKVTVTVDVALGATAIPITSASLEVAAETSVYLLPYDYKALASTNQGTYNLNQGSLLFMVNPGTATGKVQNGIATGGGITSSCVWEADSPGRAYSFDGEDDYIAQGDNSKLAQLDATDDLTLEAWVDSNSVKGTTRLIHHHSPDSKYALALKQREIVSALELDGNGDYVEVAAHTNPTTAITVSLWAKSKTENWNANGCLASKRDAYIMYSTSGSKAITFFVYAAGAWQAIHHTPSNITQWHHYGGTFDGKTLKLYIDGVEVATSDVFTNTTTINRDSGALYLGKDDVNARYFNGKIDEVCIWDQARTQAQIQADMNLRLNGNESGLVAYYHFENGLATDYTYNGHDGKVRGNPQVVTSPLPTSSYSVIAAVGNQLIESEKVLPCGSWQHLAAVFNQSYGLQFNGGYLKCGKEASLNISQDLTIEIFLKTGNLTQKQGLISKGELKDGTDQDVPYALFIDSDGKLVFAFEDKNHRYHQYKATIALSNNSFQKIALVRKRGRKTLENKETKNITVNDETVTMDAVTSVDFQEWDDIKFYIGGTQTGNYRFDGDAGTNEQELGIGRLSSSGDENYFPGTMSEVRLWNQALDQKDLYSEMKGQEKGLIAWWRMEENEGNIAYDAKSGNDGKIVGEVQWVKNPDPNGSKFGLYLNGKAVNKTTENTVSSLPWGDEQFTLGAYKNGSNFPDSFSGTLEEIRIWKVARTQEQIQDNLFTRLKGEKQDLIANYSFDLDDETELKDSSLLGNHLLIGTGDSQPTSILSTAPISNDIAQVRSALAGVKTQFHDTIDSRPAVQEYGDMQYDSEGNLTGVMKRCYTYIKDGQWHLFTGYKVGNLITEWIGQAQFNPQVIGYIEGTPPVPSENMTYGTSGTYDTKGSMVSFTQADEVMYNYSTSKENGFNSSFGMSGSLGIDLDLRMLLAPLGFGISQKMEFNLGLSSSASFEASGTWTQDQSMSTGRNVSREMSAALGGNWEDPSNMYNPAVGRRWMSGNSGFALVQSETADIFALRLAHNNALVALQFQPNPDIPKDWNIIPFPLNPRYTTQGTLDGKIGYKEDGSVCTDANYPQAATYGEYSYFKPKEAYSLKKDIDQEMQELQNYYNNFDASPLSSNNPMNTLMKSNYGLLASAAGAAPGVGMGLAAASTFGSMGDALSKDQSLAQKFAKRNIANTYVWTADGGFYAETTDTTDIVQDSVTGSYSFNNEFSSGLSLSFSALGADFEFGLDGSMGGSLNITKTKSKEATKTFSIDLSIAPSGDMQAFDPESGDPIYENGQPKLVTGRVDAYRFMTFYLDSAKENFEDLFSKVVDPIWLEQSNHPNAVAMRQANQANKKPGCWRLMHRVTFVSRVLPEFADPTAAPLESAMKAENIESNYELIKKLEPFVKSKTQNYVLFADAVRDTLKTYLPELQPHAVDIIKYAALYFGVEEEI